MFYKTMYNKNEFRLIALAVILTFVYFMHNSDKAMRYYDNQYNVCYSITLDAGLDKSSYDEFMVECLKQ